MKKIMVAAVAASLLYVAPAMADDSQLIIGISGFVDGIAVGGTYVKRKHHKKRYYEEQAYAPPPPPIYDEGYGAPPPPGECTFKSKMQGQVKCGPGMPPPPRQAYAPPPPPGYGQGYPPPYPGQYPGQYGLPMVNPVLCQPFYYQEFVPGYGWQTLRNYRC